MKSFVSFSELKTWERSHKDGTDEYYRLYIKGEKYQATPFAQRKDNKPHDQNLRSLRPEI